MRKKIKYTNEPMGDLKAVEDFLPPPHELVFKKEIAKVTISLSRDSVEFFKRKAREQHTQYQKMIRRLIDLYTAHHQ